jgi:hypothetical protein
VFHSSNAKNTTRNSTKAFPFGIQCYPWTSIIRYERHSTSAGKEILAQSFVTLQINTVYLMDASGV